VTKLKTRFLVPVDVAVSVCTGAIHFDGLPLRSPPEEASRSSTKMASSIRYRSARGRKASEEDSRLVLVCHGRAHVLGADEEPENKASCPGIVEGTRADQASGPLGLVSAHQSGPL